MDIKEATDKLAVMICQESLSCDMFRRAGFCSDDFKKKHSSLNDRIKSFVNEHFSDIVKNRTITGVYEGEISHYDIDRDLKEKFGGKISTDSESGQFFAYCNRNHEKEILEYIGKKYDNSAFKPTVSDNDYDTIMNRTTAEKYVKDNGIKVPLPDHISENQMQQLEMLEAKIRESEKSIESFKTMKKVIFK